MNDEQPSPLRDDPALEPDLRELLDGMRADVPDAAHVERLVQGTRARLSAPSPWPRVGATLTALSGVLLYALWPAAPTPEPVEPTPHLLVEAPVIVAEAAPPEALPAPVETVVVPTVRRRTRELTPVIEPVAPVPDTAVEPTPPDPETEVYVEAPPRSAPEDELALLAAARRALRADAPHALALVSEHEERFPTSAFAEERAVLRFDALLRSGRRVEAERAAEALLDRWPGSVHRRHIEETLAAP